MAAFAAGVKIDAFAYMPVQEYGNAFSTFIAQNMGAKKPERIRQGVRCGVGTVVVYCVVTSFILWFLAKPLILIFIDQSETRIVAEGIRYLHTVGPFYCGIGCLFLFYGLYRALGKPGISVVLTVISLGCVVLWTVGTAGNRRGWNLVVHPHRLGVGGSDGFSVLPEKQGTVFTNDVMEKGFTRCCFCTIPNVPPVRRPRRI